MLFLAFKQLLSKKKQTLFILLGIGLGSMLFISISGVMIGLREYIINSLLSNTSHILISGSERVIDEKEIKEQLYSNSIVNWTTNPYGKRGEAKLENYQGWVNIFNKSPEVYGYSPRITIPVILKKRTLRSSISLTGVIPQKHLKVSNIEGYISTGSFKELEKGGNKIVIGVGVAKDLGVKVGQTIEVTAKNNELSPFKIVGTLKMGDERIDRTLAFAHLREVQKLNKTPGRISEIAVSLNNLEHSEMIAELWSRYSDDKVQGWKTTNKMFMEVIKMQDVVRYFIMFAVLVVAGFGVYNVLSIMINQKRKEIAILRSLGYKPSEILELIVYQGIFLGLSGGIIGAILGFIVVYIVSNINIGLEIGKSNTLIVSYDPTIYLMAFVSSVIAAVVASILPALSASKMTPIDIIRGE